MIVSATAMAGALVSNEASTHGSDASLVHACVNQTNAEIWIAHTGPGDANTDCAVFVGPDWIIVQLDEDWTGGGTGRMFNLNDNVGIGTASPKEQLEITGNFRLPATTIAPGIIIADGNRFIHNFGLENFFAGGNADNLAMAGFGGNTGVGQGALEDNTTGESNAAVGQRALAVNTTGKRNNTDTGTSALSKNTTGSANTAIGHQALYNTTTGIFNTALGRSADVTGTNSINATAIGANASVDASNKIRLGDANVTLVETAVDMYVEIQGFGIILRDTDGLGCHRLTVNSAGTPSFAFVACP